MFTVAVTGGLGLVGRYVVQRLLENEQVAEIRILDRENPESTRNEENRRIKHFTLDLIERKSLENALKGCDAVVHCAHSEFPILYPKSKTDLDRMWKDNLDATESVVDTMTSLQIKALVNVGCAYCPIPNEDNYGLPQDAFVDYPRNYMLDTYGESRTRGEMYARKAAKRGTIDAIFLRPTIVYGVGKSRKLEALKKLIDAGSIPFIGGERRGLHQFIYAGNLAGIIEKSIFSLLQQPEKYSGELVFCQDENCALSMRDFLENRYKSPNFSDTSLTYFWSAFAQSYTNYWKSILGFEVPENTLNHLAFRLFFEKTVGFPNKKLRLLLDWRPEITQEEAFDKFATPKASFLSLEPLKRANIQG